MLVLFVLMMDIQTVLAENLPQSSQWSSTPAAEQDRIVSKPGINALAAAVIEAGSGRVLYAKNATEKRSIASTTKIMTAVVALEKGNLTDQLTISRRASSIGGSSIGLRAGEVFTLEQLLYAMLMNSANDAAIAIAEGIGGTMEKFAVMMNKKAESIGASSSNFVTPHGLDTINQYSTAYDLAIITRAAMKNPNFAKIVSTKTATIPGHSLYNTNELLDAYPGVEGVKTGYTGKAGRCLVTYVKRNGMDMISVVLGSPTRTARSAATRTIVEYASDLYKMRNLVSDLQVCADIPVYRGKMKTVSLLCTKGLTLPLSDVEMDGLTMVEQLPMILKSPVIAGDEVGSIRFLIEKDIIGECVLTVSSDVNRMKTVDYLKQVVMEWSCMMRTHRSSENP